MLFTVLSHVKQILIYNYCNRHKTTTSGNDRKYKRDKISK